jgi:hypothetical protein
MLLPRKDEQTVENAIERRLVETMVSGGVRPFRDAAPVRKASPAGTGLFLVKPGMAKMETPTRLEKTEAARGTKLRGTSDRQAQGRKEPSRVLQMPVPPNQVREQRLLGVTAALGPLLWFGHAVLVWLKVV